MFNSLHIYPKQIYGIRYGNPIKSPVVTFLVIENVIYNYSNSANHTPLMLSSVIKL